MQIIISDTISLGGYSIYNSDGAILDSYSNWLEFPRLSTGQYFITLTIHKEIDGYYVNEINLFVLYV